MVLLSFYGVAFISIVAVFFFSLFLKFPFSLFFLGHFINVGAFSAEAWFGRSYFQALLALLSQTVCTITC